MDNNDLISIIIPVYNAEKYLKRCIDSVLNQSHQNLEIIIVEDGSKDASAQICRDYMEKEEKVEVFFKGNAGAGAARRDGIKMASGDYIGFVDADDYVDLEMFRTLLGEAKKGFDIVECGYRKVDKNDKMVGVLKKPGKEIKGNFDCSFHFAARINPPNSVWNKLFKAELFNKVEFPEVYVGEDQTVLAQLYAFAEKVKIIEEILYNYVLSPNSIERSPFSLKRLDRIESGKFIFDFYKKVFPELRYFPAIYICFHAARYFFELSNSRIEGKERFQNSLVSDFKFFYEVSKGTEAKKKHCSKRRTLFIDLFHFNPGLCYIFYLGYQKFLKPDFIR